ncbi:MAG: reverse transcriptase domain-containing protein [Pirellulales bacterium]|nr:reverse transcriptase domain-containing protein [Pirellulales bacterium]
MESELFGVCRGVRQGCTLPPWLFNVFMDRVMREAQRQFPSEVRLSTGNVGVLLFADNMVVMVESVEGLQHNMQVMSGVLSKWELKVNWRKTKVMRVARKSEDCEVKIGEEVIDQVDEMKYLGVIISSDGRMEKEVEARIGSATRVIGGMNETVLKRKELSRSTKLKVVNATMIPTLLYGCET